MSAYAWWLLVHEADHLIVGARLERCGVQVTGRQLEGLSEPEQFEVIGRRRPAVPAASAASFGGVVPADVARPPIRLSVVPASRPPARGVAMGSPLGGILSMSGPCFGRSVGASLPGRCMVEQLYAWGGRCGRGEP